MSGSHSSKKKKKKFGAMADINVTPMVDVMLVMLIIFMVITPMLSKGISVELVKTKNPIAMQAADKDDAILVSVTKDGKVYLGSDQFSNLNDLGVKVKDRLTAKLDKTVYLKNDSRARYERVVEVIDNLRGFGVDQLGLLTEQIKEGGAAEGAAAPPAGK
jgi:biopolymer transport protein ExbD